MNQITHVRLDFMTLKRPENQSNRLKQYCLYIEREEQEKEDKRVEKKIDIPLNYWHAMLIMVT